MRDKKIDERRSLSRVPLDIPYFVRLSVIGGSSYKVMLGDISAKGLQTDLPSGVGPEDIPGSAKVEISDFPPGMEYLNRISGRVMWVTDGCCGIRFEQELEDDSFLDFLDSL